MPPKNIKKDKLVKTKAKIDLKDNKFFEFFMEYLSKTNKIKIEIPKKSGNKPNKSLTE